MLYSGVVTVQGMLSGLVVVVLIAGAPGSLLMVERAEGGLRHEASITKRVFGAGESIEVTITIRNTGPNPVILTFFSGQRFDLLVRRPRGDEIWRWSHDKAFIQAIQSVPIRANEPMTLKASWDQRDYQGRRADPGVYEVIPFVTGRTEGSERASIQLPALQFTIR